MWEILTTFLNFIFSVIVTILGIWINEKRKKYSLAPSVFMKELSLNHKADYGLNNRYITGTDAFVLMEDHHRTRSAFHLKQIYLKDITIKEKAKLLIISNDSKQDYSITVFINNQPLNVPEWEYCRLCRNQHISVLYYEKNPITKLEVTSCNTCFSYCLDKTEGDIKPHRHKYKPLKMIHKRNIANG